MSRATQSELLDQRIAENAASQEIDLATWVFQRVDVQPGDAVLELCCGTGGQTVPLLERVGTNGKVVALDISKTALETLVSKVGRNGHRLTTVEGNLDGFSKSLRQSAIEQASFDLVFCGYGLYYASDPRATLQEIRSWLKPKGRIAVVGPFGPNNKPLFDLLGASGVTLAEAVTFSSERFMSQVVLTWGAVNFSDLSVHTMVNPVRWNSPERVMNYWQNTTFFDAGKLPAFREHLQSHFMQRDVFTNEKWVMLVEMRRGR